MKEIVTKKNESRAQNEGLRNDQCPALCPPAGLGTNLNVVIFRDNLDRPKFDNRDANTYRAVSIHITFSYLCFTCRLHTQVSCFMQLKLNDAFLRSYSIKLNLSIIIERMARRCT